ncbi:hypothetical protein HZY83_06180, partial [Gemella sp. GH3]|uniref:hypothetical protein n=1 Tax=unclassified Gemella TaxID=2624949 RepID=UPI0015D01648
FINDLSYDASRYKLTVIFLLLFLLITIFSVFFNVFYEGKDVISLTNLPITQKEIFYSKFLFMIINSASSILILAVLNIISTIKYTNDNILLSIIIVFIYTIIISLCVLFITMLISSFLTNIKLFKKYRTAFIVVSQVVLFMLIFGSYFFMIPVFMSGEVTPISQYKGDFFLNVITSPTSFQSLSKILVLAGILVVLLWLLNKFVIEPYFTHNISLAENSNKNNNVTKQNKNKAFNKKRIFDSMTMQSFKNGTLISNNILSPFISICLFIGIIIVFRGHNYLQQDLIILPTAIIVGTVGAIFLYSTASFSALAISIDYKNFEYIKTLPLHLKQFLLRKLFISTILQILISSVLFIVCIVILNTSLFFSITAMTTFLAVSIIHSIYMFTKDLKKPFTNWNNITQLLLRGGSQMKQLLIFFAVIIITNVIIAITVLFTNIFPNLWWLLSGIYIAIIITIGVTFTIILNREIKYFQ